MGEEDSRETPSLDGQRVTITPQMVGRALARYRELREVGVSEDYLLEEVLRAALRE